MLDTQIKYVMRAAFYRCLPQKSPFADIPEEGDLWV